MTAMESMDNNCLVITSLHNLPFCVTRRIIIPPSLNRLLNKTDLSSMIVNPFPRSRSQETHSASPWLPALHKLRLAKASDASLNLGYDSNNPHD